MPITVNPSATPDFATSIVLPTAGDGVKTAAGPSPINPPIVSVLNGTEASRLLLLGNGTRRRCTCYDGALIVINPLGAVCVVIAGVTKVLPHLTASIFNTATGGALAANTRYYLYATISGGAVVFSKSTTAPDDAIHFKSGGQAFLFVSTFITDAAAAVVTYSQADAEYTYGAFVADGAGLGGNLVLDRGVAIAWTGVVSAPAVPALASSWIAQIEFKSTNSGDAGAVSFANPTGVGLGWFENWYGVSGKLQGQASGSNYAGLIFYKVQDAAADTLSIWCAGFTM